MNIYDKYLARINKSDSSLPSDSDWCFFGSTHKLICQEEALPSESCNLGSVKRALVELETGWEKPHVQDIKRCTSSILYIRSIIMYCLLTPHPFHVFFTFLQLAATATTRSPAQLLDCHHQRQSERRSSTNWGVRCSLDVVFVVSVWSAELPLVMQFSKRTCLFS